MLIYPPIAAHEQATIALVGVALGGVIAIIGGVITPIFTEAAKAEGEARQLAAAVAAEIQALVTIVDYRDYEGFLRKQSEGITQTGAAVVTRFIPVRLNPFAVTEANIDKLGLLPRVLVSEVVQLYTGARAVVEDFKTMEEQLVGRELDAIETRQFLCNLLELLITTKSFALQLLPKLDRFSQNGRLSGNDHSCPVVAFFQRALRHFGWGFRGEQFDKSKR